MAARRRLSEAEHELWQRVAASVSPLKHRPLARVSITDPSGSSAVVDRQQQTSESIVGTNKSGNTQNLTLSSASSDTIVKIPVQGLDKRTDQRLRRGKLPLEGRLDLHGMTQAQAHGALNRFIAASRAMNRRFVLVITGKGWDPMASRREESIGVLRRIVPRWLATPPLSIHVAAVSDAHAKDGGSGALYVVLRRSPRMKPRT